MPLDRRAKRCLQIAGAKTMSVWPPPPTEQFGNNSRPVKYGKDWFALFVALVLFFMLVLIIMDMLMPVSHNLLSHDL